MGRHNRELLPPQTPHTENAYISTANVTIPLAEGDDKWEVPRVTIDQALIADDPVNAFGIPQATMRCLEVLFDFFPVCLQLSINFNSS